MADVSLDMVMPSFSSAFLLANYMLQQFGWVILFIPYMFLVGLLCWQQGVFRWMELRLLQLEERTMNQQLPACRDNLYVRPSLAQRRRITQSKSKDVMVYSRWKYVLRKIVLWVEPRWLYRMIFMLYTPLNRLRYEREQRKADARWSLANVPYECRPVILPDDKAISTSFMGKGLSGSKVSVLMDVSEYDGFSTKERKREVQVTLSIPPEINKLLLSSSWTNKLDLQAIVPPAIESARDAKINRLEDELFNVRRDVSLQKWISAYNEHMQQRESLTSMRIPPLSKRTVAYKKQIDNMTEPEDALICILEDCLMYIQYVDEKRPTSNYHHLTKKMIVHSRETPIKLRVTLLIPVLRRRLGSSSMESSNTSFFGYFCPGGRRLSADQVNQVIDNFLQWAKMQASNIRAKEDVSLQVVEWHQFVSWFVGMWKQSKSTISVSNDTNISKLDEYMPLILQERRDDPHGDT